jgi:hypothetical protein
LEPILETRDGPRLKSLDVGGSKSDEILWLSSSSPFFFLLAASFLNYRVTSVSMFPIPIPIPEIPREVVLCGNQPCLGKDGPDRDLGIDGAMFGRRNQVALMQDMQEAKSKSAIGFEGGVTGRDSRRGSAGEVISPSNTDH